MSEMPARRRRRNSPVANSISDTGNDSRIVEPDDAISVNRNLQGSPPLMDTDDIVVKTKFNNAIEEYKLSHFSRAYSLFSDLCNLVPNNYILLAYKGVLLGKQVSLGNNSLSDATSQIIDSVTLAPNFCNKPLSLYEFIIWVISEFSSLYDSHFSLIRNEYGFISSQLDQQEKLVSYTYQVARNSSDRLHKVEMFRRERKHFFETDLYNYTIAENLENSAKQAVNDADKMIKETKKERDDSFTKLLEAKHLVKALAETLESFLSSIQRICENSSLITFLEFWNSIEPLMKKCNEVNSDDVFKPYRGSLAAVAFYFSEKEKEIKQQRFERYWATHPEKKNQLLSAQDACQKEISDLKTKSEELQLSIENLIAERTAILPTQEQLQKCKKQIGDIDICMSDLSIFDFKKKQRLREKREKAIKQRDRANELYKIERDEHNKRIDIQLEPLRNQLNEVRIGIDALQSKYQSLEQELTMDR